jgi:hypothetical protein
VRRLAHEAADSGLLSPELAAGISRVKGVKQLGFVGSVGLGTLLARTTVNNEQNRVCAALAANADPLIDTTKRNERCLVDSCAGTLLFCNRGDPEITIAMSQIQFRTARVFAFTECLVTLNPTDLK